MGLSKYLSGCGDHSCYINPPQGMGTNGGCRCFGRTVPRDEEQREIRRRAMAVAIDRKVLQEKVRELEAEVEQLREELSEYDRQQPTY